MKKLASEDDMRKIGTSLSAQLEAAVAAWKRAMVCYPIKSKEYKAICDAGNKTSRAYRLMREQAFSMWVDDDKVRKYFTVDCGYFFN